MRSFCFTIIFLAALMIGAGSAQPGNIYKWVDADGVIHVSDTPPPRGEAETVEEVNEITSPPAPTQPTKTAETKKPPPPPQVALYTTDWCGYCRKAKAFFEQHGIQYTEYNIEKDPAAAQRRRRLDSRRGVPLAVINGVTILGFDPTAYRNALKTP